MRSPKELHKILADRYGEYDLSSIQAPDTWTVDMDRSVEPPAITLVNAVSGRGFILDGETIQFFSPEQAPTIYEDTRRENEGLLFITKHFGD